jgi:hypothetical protein
MTDLSMGNYRSIPDCDNNKNIAKQWLDNIIKNNNNISAWDILRSAVLEIAETYDGNIKLEIDVNLKMKSVVIKATEIIKI